MTVKLESCIEGHRASKSALDPKTMDYSPLKRAEMPEITSFDGTASVVYRGSQAIKILPGLENHGLQPKEIGQKCPKS